MTKLLTTLLTLLPLLLIPLDSYADKDKGPSDRAYERANDNASFKRDDDKKKNKKKHKDDDDDDDDDDKDRKNKHHEDGKDKDSKKRDKGGEGDK